MSICTSFGNMLPGTRFTWGGEVYRALVPMSDLRGALVLVNAFRQKDWAPVVIPAGAIVYVTPEDLAESVSRPDTERQIGTS